jgi:hypothetical protein
MLASANTEIGIDKSLSLYTIPTIPTFLGGLISKREIAITTKMFGILLRCNYWIWDLTSKNEGMLHELIDRKGG